MVMSIVFLAVAIYNNGYVKGELVSSRKQRHYTYMVLLKSLKWNKAILRIIIPWDF